MSLMYPDFFFVSRSNLADGLPNVFLILLAAIVVLIFNIQHAVFRTGYINDICFHKKIIITTITTVICNNIAFALSLFASLATIVLLFGLAKKKAEEDSDIEI